MIARHDGGNTMNMGHIYGLIGGFFLAFLIVHIASPPQLSPKKTRSSAPDAPVTNQTPGSGAVATGLSVVVPGTDGDAPGMEAAIDRLQRAGAHHVSFVVALTQSDAGSADVTVVTPLPILQRAIQRARAANLSVLVRPVVAPRDGSWRSAINPAEPAVWLASYQNAIVPVCAAAQKAGADSLVVAAGLPGLETADWSNILKAARDHYKGRLLYAASGVAGVKRFRHWRDCDAVAVENVFALPDGADVAPGAVATTWRNAADDLEQVINAQGLDTGVTVTSAGFAAVQGGLKDPDHPPRGASPDPGVPQQAIAGFYETWGTRPWLKGVYWHTWWTASGRSPFLLDGQAALTTLQPHW